MKNLKRTSPGYEIPDENKKNDPKDKVELIFRQLEKLKNRTLNPTFDERNDLDDEILKEVYDKSVKNLLNLTDNKKRIHEIFTNFNFDLVMAQPKEILILLLIDSVAIKSFTKFLSNKHDLTSRDVDLILNFLCQTNFESKKLIELLERNTSMYKIMKVFSNIRIPIQCPGYFNLIDKQVLKIAEKANIIEQTRLRIQCERRNEYSVGLNHLLNEIHAICYVLHNPSVPEKDYNTISVGDFLISKRVSHDTCLKIRNLFDKRNKNPVSHADSIAWLVSKEEYFEYRHHVAICLNYLL